MATSSKTATIAQAQAYLKDLGYNNPDSGEIQGAIQDLNSNPSALTKYASVDTSNDSSSGQGIQYDPSWALRGITQDVWNQADATQRAVLAMGVNVGETTNTTGNKYNLSDGIQAALNDPSFLAKFTDAYNIDKDQLQQSLVSTQISLSDTAQQQKIKFEQDRKALAEQQAANGTAYSGFRQQAQNNLAATENGIVTSTRSQAQQSLNQAQQAFEAKYGSSNTPTLFLNYTDPLNNANTSVSGLNRTPQGDSVLEGNTIQNITGTSGLPNSQNPLGGTDYQSALNQYAQNFVNTGGGPTIKPINP